MKNDILLFLGSGTSYASKLPTVTEVTDSIFEDQWFDNTAATFSRGIHPSEFFQNMNIVPKLKEFLKIIRQHADVYLTERRSVCSNYEDLFYICRQISDNEKYEIDNPAICPYIKKIKAETIHLCGPLGIGKKEIDLDSLASESMIYINCVVHNALYTDEEPKGLNLILELKKIARKFDIATLNHDLLIERILKINKVKYIDGFGKLKGDVRWFEPKLYEKKQKRTHLYKLHGSIDWFGFREAPENSTDGKVIDKYGLAIKRDENHCKNEKGKYLTPLNRTPIFLTGTYNKLMDYNYGIIQDIHNKFNLNIYKHDLIVMSGYGWNDKGINALLFKWLYSSGNRRIYLLHREPEEKIKKNSKSPMWHSFDRLVEEGRLIPIKKWFSEVQVQDLMKVISETT